MNLIFLNHSGLIHNKNDFIHHSKTRFNSDSFVEDIDFDFLEIQVIEED